MHKKGVKPIFLSFQTKSGKSGHGGKTHKKCVSENVNGTENPGSPHKQQFQHMQCPRVLKEGRKKMLFFLFTRPRFWALQLPSVSWKGPPVQARVPSNSTNYPRCSKAHQIVLNPLGSRETLPETVKFNVIFLCVAIVSRCLSPSSFL